MAKVLQSLGKASRQRQIKKKEEEMLHCVRRVTQVSGSKRIEPKAASLLAQVLAVLPLESTMLEIQLFLQS